MTLVHLQLSDKDNVDVVNTWLSEHPSVTVHHLAIYGSDVYLLYS